MRRSSIFLFLFTVILSLCVSSGCTQDTGSPEQQQTGKPADTAANSMVMDAGEVIASSVCKDCHDENLATPEWKSPILDGQNADYLGNSIKAYQTGRRPVEIKTAFLSRLSADDVVSVTKYYAGLTGTVWTGSKTIAISRQEASGIDVAKLTNACVKCHGKLGMTTNSTTPRISGQNYRYLMQVMQEYQSGVRDQAVVHGMIRKWSTTEIDAVAAYYAGS